MVSWYVVNCIALYIYRSQMPKEEFGLLNVKMYGPNAYKPQQRTKWKQRDEIREERVDRLKTQSPWPPRNAKEFDRLNRYTERFEGAFINRSNATFQSWGHSELPVFLLFVICFVMLFFCWKGVCVWPSVRCCDVLELVQTVRHFRLLSTTAAIGGAGTTNLDVLVHEIHQKYTKTIDEFLSAVPGVLNVDEADEFAEAFFVFRSVIRVWKLILLDI